LRLEVYRLRTGVSWYEAKAAIVRDAIRSYLAHPNLCPPSNCVSPNLNPKGIHWSIQNYTKDTPDAADDIFAKYES